MWSHVAHDRRCLHTLFLGDWSILGLAALLKLNLRSISDLLGGAAGVQGVAVTDEVEVDGFDIADASAVYSLGHIRVRSNAPVDIAALLAERRNGI